MFGEHSQRGERLAMDGKAGGKVMRSDRARDGIGITYYVGR